MKKEIAGIICIIIVALLIATLRAIKANVASSYPVSATVSYADQSVSLKWKAAAGSKQYLVYRDGKLLRTTRCTSYMDRTALSKGSKGHTYKVMYETVEGKKWILEERQVSFVPSYTKLTATSSTCSSINLQWEKDGITSYYQIYMKQKNEEKWSLLKTTPANKYTAKNLCPFTEYEFMVKPCNKVGGECVYGKHSSVSMRTKAIDNPNAKPQKNGIKWKCIPGVTGYRVCKYTSSGWQKIYTGNATSMRLPHGRYKVQAYVTYKGRDYGSPCGNGVTVNKTK